MLTAVSWLCLPPASQALPARWRVIISLHYAWLEGCKHNDLDCGPEDSPLRSIQIDMYRFNAGRKRQLKIRQLN